MNLKSNKNQESFTREQLYDIVWSKPIKSIAATYKIPEYSLSKICKDNNIPLPMLGYWSKVKFNKSVIKTTLPKVDNLNSSIMECLPLM